MTVLPRFTPSLLDGETLERLFVGREHLLAGAIACIERAATSSDRSHKLFVGPRGAGKTHLVSLVHHRASQLPGYGVHFQLAWLPEDSWTIASLDDLIEEVLEHVEPGPVDRQGPLVDDLLRVADEHGPVVVLVENLDRILDAIGPEGQRRLRGLLENHRPMLFIATASRITDDLMSQAEPFYGFFDTTTLEPFGLDEAAAMLRAIAEERGDQALARQLSGHRAHARLAAVQHLAGGQPRVWALLGAGLSVERLDELVTALIESFDDLTPYYQEQLARLSPNERKVVKALADTNHAMTVRQLAEATRIEQRSLAKTMTELRRNGWVRTRSGLLTSMVDQRLSFYELAEPLARLAFQLKAARGRPVRLVLDFLAAWYDREELAETASDDRSVTSYLNEAVTIFDTEPILAICHVLTSADPVVPLFANDQAWEREASILADAMQLERTLSELDDALVAYQHGDARPLLMQPVELSQLVEHRLGSMSASSVRIEISQLAIDSTFGQHAAWTGRSEDVLSFAGRSERAAALLNLARWQMKAERIGAAVLTIRQAVIAFEGGIVHETVSIALATAKDVSLSGNWDLSLAMLQALRPHVPVSRLLAFATAYGAVSEGQGRCDESVLGWEGAASRLVAELGPDHPDVLAARARLARACHAAGRLGDAVAIEEQLARDSERLLGPDHPDVLTARAYVAASYRSIGRRDEAIGIEEQLVIDRIRVFGPNHPDVFTAQANLATAYSSSGQPRKAVVLAEELVRRRAEVFGPDDADGFLFYAILAEAYRAVGRWEDAITTQQQVVLGSRRVRGPDSLEAVIALANLVCMYRGSLRHDEALVVENRLLDDWVRRFGPDHPNAPVAMSIVASLLELAGRAAEAGTLMPNRTGSGPLAGETLAHGRTAAYGSRRATAVIHGDRTSTSPPPRQPGGPDDSGGTGS